MSRWFILIALLFSAVAPPMAPMAAAADDVRPAPIIWRYNNHPQELPFTRSERAASAWASGACWSDCGSYCAWGMAGCLQRDAQGQCIKLTDKCDRYCQRECRTAGGPFLPLEMPWD